MPRPGQVDLDLANTRFNTIQYALSEPPTVRSAEELPLPLTSLVGRRPTEQEYMSQGRSSPISYGQQDTIFSQEPETPINNLGLRQWTHFPCEYGGHLPDLYFAHLTGATPHDRYWRADRLFHAASHADEAPIETKTPLFGIELEVECLPKVNVNEKYVTIIRDAPQFLLTKRDGSLNERGIELCSVPATHLAHYRGWEPFFRSHAKDVQSYTSPRCGMHIHLRRAAWKKTTLMAFSDFLNQPPLQIYLTRIAGRPVTTEKTYSLRKSGRRLHNYAQQFPKQGLRSPDRYAVVNTSPHFTIEVRMFRGNASRLGFFKNLDFVASLIHFCDEYVVSAGGYSETSTPPPASDYLDWVTAQNRKHLYPAINEWMRVHFKWLKREAK